MVSMETVQPAVNKSTTMDQPTSSPRISFSSEFLDENNFISISPNHRPREIQNQKPPLSPSPIRTAADLQFEFLSNTGPAAAAGHAKMLTADELFFEGKLLAFWQMQQSERLHKIGRFMKEVQVAEARAFYGFQIAIENICHFPCHLPLSRLLRSSATVTSVCRYRRELHLSLLFVAVAAVAGCREALDGERMAELFWSVQGDPTPVYLIFAGAGVGFLRRRRVGIWESHRLQSDSEENASVEKENRAEGNWILGSD
ncbi:unnamed protein product [Linum trigynum]|uniref:Uncharacterized protein n=1 Tax=Linum trigynum TaxID=586398 RepID=A0AAV2EGJ9_9ROSI